MKTKSSWQVVNGDFILDKPVGLSSNQALQKARRIFQAKKAGHTGSLDVLASGLLPICFGEATKFSQYLLDADKTYYTVAQLGKRTTTCDAEGEIVEEKTIDHVGLPLIETTLKKFIGEIEQIPSMYSALKYNGQPLYKLARKGIEIERKKRKITIYSIELLSFHNDLLELKIHCSKGTYIRNLVDDIGQALNCGAYVKALRRLESGPFQQNQMHTLEEIAGMKTQLQNYLLPIDSLLTMFPSLVLSTEDVVKLQQGQRISISQPIAPNLSSCDLIAGSRKEDVVKLQQGQRISMNQPVAPDSSSCGLTAGSRKIDVTSLEPAVKSQDDVNDGQNSFRVYNKRQQLIGLVECLSDGFLKAKRLTKTQR